MDNNGLSSELNKRKREKDKEEQIFQKSRNIVKTPQQSNNKESTMDTLTDILKELPEDIKNQKIKR